MQARLSLARPWQLAAGWLVALVIARWQLPLGLACGAVWAGIVYRQPLAGWTEALRFDPRLIATTPAFLAGLIICLALLLLALFPARFAPFAPTHQTLALETIGGQIMAAPF